MSTIAVPAWCRWRAGRSAVLIVAPHGGRRAAQPGASRGAGAPYAGAYTRKVNDLYTADLAEELAESLAAGVIVNPEVDRNHLDLNRVSQVAARAPWFLALIEALLEDILARHACAEVLFVHGWNIVQPKCDIGIGHALADAAAARTHADSLTISPDYAGVRLEHLRARCADEGIATAFGERYAARHPNNFLQLFRAVSDNGAATPRLRTWAGEGRVQAVQLELGVPLRWPGPYRRAFVRAAHAAFDVDHGAAQRATGGGADRERAAPAPSAPALHPRVAERPAVLLPPPASLQLYDPHADVGLSARIDRSGAHGVNGRVLLLLGGNRVALFLGEDPRGIGAVSQGPDFTPAPDGFALRFSGPALAAEDGALYVDLEQAFAASRLCSVAVDVQFRSGLSAEFGPASGWIAVDGARRDIAAPAFARHGILQRSAGAWSSQVVLSAAFGARRALRVHFEFPGRGGVLHELTAHGEREETLPPLTLHLDRDRYTPEQMRIGDGALLCHPLSRMAITRPLAAHRHARVTFGAARFTCADAEGFGFYEYARALV
jgi:hypothetical protein